MKKNLNLWLSSNSTKKKLIMELKLAFIIILLSVTNVFGARSYSQAAKVTLDMENKTLEQVMDEIEKQSEFYFIFNQKQIDVKRVVNIREDNKKIDDVLYDLFAETDVNYAVFDRKILLTTEPIKGSIITERSKVEAQKITVRGTVTDQSNGSTLPGVNVVVRGTTIGVVTDGGGSYTLEIPDASATLVFSFIGYISQEVPVSGRTTLNVSLAPDVEQLSEVVVVGYGTQVKRNVTGAIASVKSDNLIKSAQTSFTQTLEGKIPGLTALQKTGQPGAGPDIKIRSNPSFASSGVLYILDGVPVNDNAGEPSTRLLYGAAGVSRTPLNFINPNDIESIQVLKDAAAASIYGARAGAGVILITTKRGATQKPKIEYTGNVAFQEPASFYEVLGSKDYMIERNRILRDMYLRNNKLAPYGTADPSAAPPFVPKYTDSQINGTVDRETATEAITRKGMINQHNISLSGGNSETRYFISGNYLGQKGVLRGSGYERYNGRINLDQKIGERVKLGVNINTSNSLADNANVGTESNENSSIIKSAFYYPGNLPFTDENGNYLLNPDYVNSPNPISFLTVTDKTNSKRLLTSGFAEWTITPGLIAKANLSYDQSSSKRSTYFPKTFLKGLTAGGDASIVENSNTSALMEYTLNYALKVGENHNFNFLAGYSYQKSGWEGVSLRNYQFLTDQFLYNNMSAGAAPRPSVGSSKSEQIWASYFGRAIYEFKDKYLLTAVIRRDGSSVFAEDKKYGIFPSVSAGWIVSEEQFFKDNISFINFLKLRASYGTTGNSNIGGNAFAYYSTGWNYVFNNTNNVGVYLSQLNNDRLTWETAKEINLGLDFQIMKNRISGSFDYFNKTVVDLLNFRPLPTNFPVSSIADNIGKTRSRGWEIGLQSRNFVSSVFGGFEWETEFTLSHYYDFWVERSPASLKILEKYIDPQGPFNGLYGYKSGGLYTLGDTPPSWMPGILPGTIIVQDLNGYDANGELTGEPDGKITSADRVLWGISDPKFSFGLTNNFRYKNFDLSIYMYGVVGIKFNDDLSTAFVVESQLAQFGWNMMTEMKDRWSYDNTDSKYPSGLSSTYSGYATDFWKEDGSFLRCQDITLGYTLPTNLIRKQKVLSRLRLTVSVQNAFVITNYSGIDPELTSWVAYPNPRSLIFGLNASF